MFGIIRKRQETVPAFDVVPLNGLLYHGTASYDGGWRTLGKGGQRFKIEEEGIVPFCFSSRFAHYTPDPREATAYAVDYCKNVEFIPWIGKLPVKERLVYVINANGVMVPRDPQNVILPDKERRLFQGGGLIPREFITGRYTISDPESARKLIGSDWGWSRGLPENLTFEQLLPFMEYRDL